jgi:hypothetical protein
MLANDIPKEMGGGAKLYWIEKTIIDGKVQ